MSGSAREEIFGRLRDLASGSSAGRIDLERKALGSADAPTPPADEKCQAFITNVLANRGSVACAANRSEADSASPSVVAVDSSDVTSSMLSPRTGSVH